MKIKCISILSSIELPSIRVPRIAFKFDSNINDNWKLKQYTNRQYFFKDKLIIEDNKMLKGFKILSRIFAKY